MSQLDELKEEVSWYKALFLVLFAADASVVAWRFNGYETATQLQLILATLAVIVISILLVLVNVKAFKKIKKIKDL